MKSVEFTGKLHIPNPLVSRGKILLDNGDQSGIIAVPPHFEDGDRAIVTFRNNDPFDDVITLHIEEQIPSYGKIIRYDPERRIGKILSNYPHPIGTVFFHINAFQKKLHIRDENEMQRMDVKFILGKNERGIHALHIEKDGLSGSERFHCRQQPTFGVMQYQSNPPPEQCGFIDFVKLHDSASKEGFGFVRPRNAKSQDDHIFFYISTFYDAYHRLPRRNDIVFFMHGIDNWTGKKRIVAFLTEEDVQGYFFFNDKVEHKATSSTYRNFHKPNPAAIYYAYMDHEHQISDLYEMNPTIKSQAISCFLSRDIPDFLKLSAISHLISVNWSNHDFSQKKLRVKRIQALDDLIDNLYQKEATGRAFYLECYRQSLALDTTRFKKFDGMGKRFNLQMSPPQIQSEPPYNPAWNIQLQQPRINSTRDDVRRTTRRDRLMFEAPSEMMDTDVHRTPWRLDFTSYTPAKAVHIEQPYYNITPGDRHGEH